MAKHYKNGRSTGDGRHIRIPHVIMDTEAYLSLLPPARVVLQELLKAYNGSNNGKLGLSVRRAAERSCISKDSAARAFQALEDAGFIEMTTKGSFRLKNRHASEWRITWLKCDLTGALPTRKYRTT